MKTNIRTPNCRNSKNTHDKNSIGEPTFSGYLMELFSLPSFFLRASDWIPKYNPKTILLTRGLAFICMNWRDWFWRRIFASSCEIQLRLGSSQSTQLLTQTCDCCCLRNSSFRFTNFYSDKLLLFMHRGKVFLSQTNRRACINLCLCSPLGRINCSSIIRPVRRVTV